MRGFSIAQFLPFLRQKEWVIALSGGPDSLGLLAMLLEYQKEFGAKIIALHVDHQFRPESGAEARKLQEKRKKINVDCHILTITKKIDANKHHQGRYERYDLMGEWCRLHGHQAIYLAHTQDDCYENFWLRLHRGSGIKGLAPMKSITGAKD